MPYRGTHLVSQGEQGVSGQNGFSSAENQMRSGLAAPQLGIVKIVVVQQSRGMKQLQGAGNGMIVIFVVPERPGEQHGEYRADTFAATADDVLGNIPDQPVQLIGLFVEKIIDSGKFPLKIS